MPDETFTERRGVTREDLRALEKNFDSKFSAHETLDNSRFEAMEKIHQERHEAVRLRLEAVGKNVHDLRGQLTEVFALPGRVGQLVSDLKDMPTNKDMSHLSETFTTRFDGFEQARREEKAREVQQQAEKDKTAVAFRWKVGIALAVGGPIFMLFLQGLAKKWGWI